MSFTFDFADDDSGSTQTQNIDYKEFMNTPTSIDAEHEPHEHSIRDLLRTDLVVSYDSNDKYPTPRRDLFDVRHELMQRDTLSPTEEILIGSTNEDIRVNTYEGGLKVWECSFDMVDVLQSQETGPANVVELGCGAALPSAYVLQQCIKADVTDLEIVVADYNASVLQLVTAPNMLLAWKSGKDGKCTGETEFTQQLVDEFISDLEKRRIKLRFVSGAWSSQFTQLVGQANYDLVLASETIYSPETLPVFTDTMLNLLKPSGKALVAAKKVYFGVGGGVPDLERNLDLRTVVKYHHVFEKPGGVGRAVLQVNL